METMTKKQLNRKLFNDDFYAEIFAQKINCAMDEFDPGLDEGLLSGHDLIDMDGEWEEESVCLDSFLASQMLSFNN